MARRLTAIAAAVLALALSGCNEGTCTSIPTNDLQALLIGLFCWGADFPEHDSPPVALALVNPFAIDSGDEVTLIGTAAFDLEGDIERFEWDADGVAGFEIDAGVEPVTETRVFSQGSAQFETRTIRLRVTDDAGQRAEATTSISVERTTTTGPTASFTFRPNPVQARSVVIFDGRGSTGASTFEWDLDGDGTFEGPRAPAIEHVYATAGTRNVTLRVSDAAGLSDTETAEVRVIDARAAAAARRTIRARLTRVRLPDGLANLHRVRVRGRFEARGAPRRFRRARWTARLHVTVAGLTTKLRGRAVARFPRGAGRVCLKLRATRRVGAPTGRITILGGRGPAARLRGGGTFIFSFRGATPRPTGRLNLRLGQPRRCP